MEPMVSMAVVEVGNYVNPWKLLAAVVILLPWAKMLTWIDKDTVAARLPRTVVNAGNMVGLLAAYLLLPLEGAFWLVLLTLLAIPILELGVYLLLRFQSVGLGDLQQELKRSFSNIGKGKGKSGQTVAAGFVQIQTKAGVVASVPDEQTPERQTFDAVQQLMATALRKRADRIDIVLGEATALSFWVDGIRYDGGSVDRALGASMIQYLKMSGGLDLNERRKPQSGLIKTQMDSVRHELTVRTAGSKTGEALALVSDIRKRHDFKLETLGLDENQIELIRSVVQEPSGLVLVAAPPGHGLRSAVYAILRAHDAFLTHILTVERAPDSEIEGITQVVIPHAASGQEELEKVKWVASQEPDVIAVPVLIDSGSAQIMAGFAAEKRAYVGLRCGSAFEALAMWRKLVGDDMAALSNLRLVVSGRLVRKLCDACKIGYAPDANQLRKMNIDPARVTKLFQARTSPMRDSKGNPVPCTFCQDMAYNGRGGAYEVLVVDDEIRQLLTSGASSSQLKTAFRRQKGRYIQEKALVMVEDGRTSVQEVLRVMKGEAPHQPSPDDSGGPRG